MVHKKNHDLRAELAEAQIAAQNWEQKWAETEALRQNAVSYWVGQNTELRAELGQASRELMAVSEQLDTCRVERSEALDNLRTALGLLDEATNFVDSYGNDIVTRSVDFIRRFRPLTPEGDTSESEAVAEMHTTCLHEGFSHTKNLECPKLEPLALTEDRTEAQLRADGDWVDEHEEEDPDLNEASEFEVVQS